MATEMKRMQQRRDVGADWEAEDPILLAGEIGLEIVAGQADRFKIGDGTTSWNDLPYFNLFGVDPLARSKAVLAETPDLWKACLLGDSTSFAGGQAGTILRRWFALDSQKGESLEGAGSADLFTDGVANGTTTFTSATANFTSADVGRIMHGQGFPSAVMVASVTNATTVVLNASVPTGSPLRFWIGRHLSAGG